MGIIGKKDIPVTNGENLFGTEDYVSSLSTFILDCDTPMTIAIQGDWGTGKTSFINLITRRIGIENESKKRNTGLDRCKTVYFNTWQYSQFNLGDNLPILLMSSLINTLAEGIDATDIKETATVILKTLLNLGISRVSGGGTDGTSITNSFDMSIVDKLVKLKGHFQEIINKQANEYGKVVIFVDDLDRLQPEKAVELLEVMKIFLDCENCVFVLAIDYGVVSQGVKAKYGDMDENKAQSFFDKIIQLPFKMPVGQYQINKYLNNLMKDIWGTIDSSEKDDIEQYINIIDCTIGKNPRSIKRTVNAFTVIDLVAQRKSEAYTSEHKKAKQRLLFALLCIQLSEEPLYNYLVSNADQIYNDSSTFLNNLHDDNMFSQIICEIYKLNELPDIKGDYFRHLENVIEPLFEWCNDLIQLYSNPKDGAHAVAEMLSFSSITSQNATQINSRSCDSIEEFKKLVNDKYKIGVDLFCELHKNIIIDDVEPIFWRSNMHMSVKTKKTDGKMFADVYLRAKTLSIDLYPNDKKEFRKSFADAYEEGNITDNDKYRYLSVNTVNKDRLSKVLDMIKYCYTEKME